MYRRQRLRACIATDAGVPYLFVLMLRLFPVLLALLVASGVHAQADAQSASGASGERPATFSELAAQREAQESPWAPRITSSATRCLC